jgi:flagellin-like hook-associated protein FlgL
MTLMGRLKEMMEFTKNNIISQAATAMLEGLAA